MPLSLSERHGSESIRLSSWVSSLGWPDSRVTIFLWSRSRCCMV